MNAREWNLEVQKKILYIALALFLATLVYVPISGQRENVYYQRNPNSQSVWHLGERQVSYTPIMRWELIWNKPQDYNIAISYLLIEWIALSILAYGSYTIIKENSSSG